MNGTTKQYVSFELAGGLYGLDIRVVKEVNPNTDIAPVPRSPDYIRGLVNIRGQVALVLDLSVLFGGKPARLTERSKIIILKTSHEIQRLRENASDIDAEGFSDKPVGCLVDSVADVLSVDESNLASAPAHTNELIARYIEGVVQLEKRLLVVLDPAQILRSPENVQRGPMGAAVRAQA